METTISTLEEKRKNAEIIFSNFYYGVKEIAEKLDVQLKLRRVAVLQTNRENHPVKSCEEYFRWTIYVQLLDHLITDLKYRLSLEFLDLFSLRVILSKTETKPKDGIALGKIVDKYQEVYGHSTTFIRIYIVDYPVKGDSDEQGKITRFCFGNSWSVIEMFITIHKLLHILVTLPVRAATAKQSFSNLRRLQTWLRIALGKRDSLASLSCPSTGIFRQMQKPFFSDLRKEERHFDFAFWI